MINLSKYKGIKIMMEGFGKINTFNETTKYLKINHKNSKTTEIYTHVITKKLFAIKNSLDSLLAGCGI